MFPKVSPPFDYVLYFFSEDVIIDFGPQNTEKPL